MIKDMLFIAGCLVLTIVFGIYTIKKVILSRSGNNPTKIERTIEVIDPEYDSKHPKRN
jgi:di/tricarboxylate transporter